MESTVKLVKDLITLHDLTHVYSDDNEAYKRGQEEYKTIIDCMNELSEEQKIECRKHWNLMVDKKINSDYADDWKIPEVHNDTH